MREVDIFTARDLRVYSGNLLKDAEKGRISIITKHGKPSILAVPFTGKLLNLGIDKDIAVTLFEKRLITLSKASKIASISIEDFTDILAEAGIAAVDYPPEELEKEMRISI